MDEDFQQRYQAAERAYSAGQYDEARRIATVLLDQLVETPSDSEQKAAVLGWRAFVALLLGHIELHGLGHPGEASDFFQTVLDSQPHNTLKELAQQGLERAAAMAATAPTEPTEPNPVDITIQPQPQGETAGSTAMPDLLRDPFLPVQADSDPGQTTSIDPSDAMPWLDPTPEPTRHQTGDNATEPPTAQEPESSPEPTNQEGAMEPDPMELLAGNLLRVKLPPRSNNRKAGEPPAESPGSSWLQRLLRRR